MTWLLTMLLTLACAGGPGEGRNLGILGCEGRTRASYKTGFTKYPRADGEGFYGGFGRWGRIARTI